MRVGPLMKVKSTYVLTIPSLGMREWALWGQAYGTETGAQIQVRRV